MLIKKSNKLDVPKTCGHCPHILNYPYYDVVLKQQRILYRCGHPEKMISQDGQGRATAVQPSQPPPAEYCPFVLGYKGHAKNTTTFFVGNTPLPAKSNKLIMDLLKKEQEGKL